jgi:hypothetical protein
LDHRVLLGSALFITQSGAKIAVGEILFDPSEYEGEIGPDPIEGRGYGTTTARVMAARAGGAPVIFSYAHGGMIYTLKHDVGSISTGFETAFKAKDKSAQRSFTVAMANAEISQVDRTRLVKRAADFFGVGFNDLKRDIKTEAAASEIQWKQSQPRKDGRFVLRYFPAEHARSVETVAKYVGSLNPPIIYDHGGRLTIIVPVPIQKSTLHRWAVRLLDRALAALRVNRHIRFQAGDEPEDIPPPRDVIEGLIANDPPRMPPLFAIRSTPQVSPTGEINLTGGYHQGIFYDGSCGALAVPERPTLEDAKAAWEFVKRELLSEFPFDSEIDVAVTLALLVTMLIRLDFPTAPAFVISAPKSGTGKSLLASILIFLILGTDAEPSTYKSDDEPEIRKVLTAHIAEGAQVVFFDNVTRSIGCAPLDLMLTSPNWKDRVLGTSTMYSGRQNVTVVHLEQCQGRGRHRSPLPAHSAQRQGLRGSDNPPDIKSQPAPNDRREARCFHREPADHRALASASRLAGRMSARLVRGLGAAGWWPRPDADRVRSSREPGIPARGRPQGRGRASVIPHMGRMVRRAGGHGQPRLPGMAACSQLSQRRGSGSTVFRDLRGRRRDLRQRHKSKVVRHATGRF